MLLKILLVEVVLLDSEYAVSYFPDFLMDCSLFYVKVPNNLCSIDILLCPFYPACFFSNFLAMTKIKVILGLNGYLPKMDSSN